MFGKVNNVDLMNRLTHLENKLDIINTNLDSQSLEGCCNCKTKETLVYKELRDYLESAFADLLDNITTKLDNKLINENKIVTDTFEKYKCDIMDNLQTIIKTISTSNNNTLLDDLKKEMVIYKKDTERDVSKILTLFENVNKSIDEKLIKLNNIIQTGDENMINKFDIIDVKLNSIYFENEIIKHQLSLEDEIRQSIEEIENINSFVNATIQKIDTLINNP